MAGTPETIDEYIAAQPKHAQLRLKKLRQTIRKAAPGVTESISYQIPAFRLDGRMLIYFAAWTEHLAVYPIPPGPKAFEKKIAPYKKGKGTLHFPFSQPMPYDLITETVGFALKRNETLGKGKKTAKAAKKAA